MKLIDLVGIIWGIQSIVIVDYKFNNEYKLDKLKEESLFDGQVMGIRSELYKPLYDKKVINFGVIDGVIVIQVE